MTKTKIEKIIFIIADTLRAKNVGLYNKKIKTTSNIDALGKSGIVFDNAYASITSTDPSITSIMSGMYPLSLGLVNHAINVSEEEEENASKVITIAEILKTKGFKTAALDWLSRWHKNGYDYYSGKIVKNNDFSLKSSAAFRGPFHLFLRILDKIAVKFLKRDFFIRFYYALSPHPRIPYDPADVIVEKAIKILTQNKKGKLFLYLHFWDAHAPHTRPKGLKSYLLSTVDDTYNAEIAFLDEQIGHLIAYLERTKLIDKTLLIFTADHGENFYEHDVPFNHENLYENIVKVPLILKHPIFGQKRIHSLVQHIDIFPTILDLLNIPINQEIDGKSLEPIIFGEKRKIRNFLYFEDLTRRKLEIPKAPRRRGIRRGKYKYIQTLRGENQQLYGIMPMGNFSIAREELYDIKSDPEEEKNIAKDKPLVVRRLKKELEDIIFALNIKRFQKDLLKEGSYSYNPSPLFQHTFLEGTIKNGIGN